MTAARCPSTRSAERPDCSVPHRAGEGAAIAAARLAPSLVHAGEGAPSDNELRPDGQVGGALTSTALDAPSLEPKAPAAGSEAAGASLSGERKFCLNCGARIWRRTGKETNPQWARRKFCGHGCSAAYRKAHPESWNFVPSHVEQQPRILREWPPEERFDRPGMVVHEKPRGVCRVTGTPEWSRWI